MQWIQWSVPLIALLLLFLLLRSRSRPAAETPDQTADSLSERMTAAAQAAATGQGRCRVCLPRRRIAAFERDLSFLLSLPQDELLPAAVSLCKSGRFLQQEAWRAFAHQKGIPSLPRGNAKQARVCLFAQELLRCSPSGLSPQLIHTAAQAWQSVQPMTVAELDGLPLALRITLLERLMTLCAACASDQRAVLLASRVQRLLQEGKTTRAHRIMLRKKHRTVFWKRLLRSDAAQELCMPQLEALGLSAQEIRPQEQAHQSELSRETARLIDSLHTLRHAPWEDMLESLSLTDAALRADPVYGRMTPDSRAVYRQRVAQVAKQTRLSEKLVVSGAMTLCRNAEGPSLEGHVGYYLMDDGYAALLRQLQAATVLNLFRLFMRRHACNLYRLASWLAFGALLAAAWRLKLNAALCVPAAALGLYALRRLMQSFFGKRPLPSLRIQLDQLPPDAETLVVCPVALHSAAQAIAAVKHLSIQQKANPDPHLHFLLLGEFPVFPGSVRSADSDIAAAAASAVEALCADSEARFFYLQRDRTCVPGMQAALTSLLQLIAGKPHADAYAFPTADPAWFTGRYRYVISLNSDTLLPPGSALRMVGAMLHPLRQRMQHNRSMRGCSAMQPQLSAAPHQLRSRLTALLPNGLSATTSRFDQALFGCCRFAGIGIVDPVSFTQSAQASDACSYLDDVSLYTVPPHTLEGFLRRVHQQISKSWQRFACYRSMDLTSRFLLWRGLFRSLIAPLQVLLVLYAAATGRLWLWALVLLLPQGGLFSTLFHNLILPCTAYAAIDALFRELWQFLSGRQLPLSWSFSTRRKPADRPPMLFFGLNMSGAGLLAAFSLLPHASRAACWITAASWTLLAFVLPFLEQRPSQPQPTAYMREKLLHAARHTLTFFETAITESDHGLPTDHVQIDPNKGIAHHTTPEAIGLYLCALLAAQKLGLLSAREMAQRMEACVHSLEAMPKWKGLPFERYDTRTLQPFPSLYVSSGSCGILAVCLLCGAQGVRSLLRELDETAAQLAARMDELVHEMQLEALYHREARLFLTGVHTAEHQPDRQYESLMASPARLLSYAAIMLGKVPLAHWHALNRVWGVKGMLSQTGGMAEYMLPLLFQPLVSNTLLSRACRSALRCQRRIRLGGAYGVSESACFAFDAELHYQRRAFGVPALALKADTQCSALSPYAAFLSLALDPKRGFLNIQKLERLGLLGPLGYFEAADFSKARIQHEGMKIVRSHIADHQAMILCAVCNALCAGYLVSLFSNLPASQAFRLLLEEPAPRVLRWPERMLRSVEEAAPTFSKMQRSAAPLRFPVDAHILSGDGTVWLIDAQGGGFLRRGEAYWTAFHESCWQPSGPRIYLRDSQSGEYWLTTDPYLMSSIRFETAQAVFAHAHSEISCEMRLWVNPLDGSAVHCLALENHGASTRVMEVCSYLEPDFSSKASVPSGRIGRSGAYVGPLQQIFVTDQEISLLRIQCDRDSFIGRGRTFYAPRALEMPISAVADVLGETALPCLTLRSQFTLPAGGSAVCCFITQQTADALALCERYDRVDAVLRTYDAAVTASAAAVRFLCMDVPLQTLSSRIAGALAYTGQPHQGGAAEEMQASVLQALRLDPSSPMLLVICGADCSRENIAQLLKLHAFLRMRGFGFDLVFALRVRTRASFARNVIEEEIERSTSRQWKDQREGVFLIERADENELALLQCFSRLTLQADQPLETQLDALDRSVQFEHLYLPRSSAPWKTQLPAAEEVQLFNGFGGFTREGDYQVCLETGAHTPAPWCNPLCRHGFCTMADESGLNSTWIDQQQLTGSEAFYLRDDAQHLLWSPTRMPLGQGLLARVVHAPGETVYESSAYGLYVRISCLTDERRNVGLRTIHIKNEDQVSRTFTLLYTCLFNDSAWLHEQADRVCGWDPAIGQAVGVFSLNASNGCTPVVMSSGLLQGLWTRFPFALTAKEGLRSIGGSAALICFPLVLEAGESVTVSTGIACSRTMEEWQAMLRSLQMSSASELLHQTRRFWQERLDRLVFDLPDPAFSALLNRWLPYQTQTAQMVSASVPLGHVLALLLTHPQSVPHQLLKAAEQPQPKDVFERLLLPYVAARYAQVGGNDAFLAQPIGEHTLLEICVERIDHIETGAYHLPFQEKEIAWHGMFLCEAVRLLAPFCPQETQERLNAKRTAMLNALDQYAWAGSWYLYGWDEKGKPIEERRLDLVTQCWAVMSGVSRDRCEIAMENVWRMLYQRESGVLLPCEAAHDEQPALSALWAASAMQQLGHIERAWEWIYAALPLYRSSTRQLAARYHAEPYALAQAIHTDGRLCGRGMQAWLWPESGWCWLMLAEQFLGVRKRGDTLRFSPAVPDTWDSVHLTYRFGSATYHLHALRTCTEASANGEPLASGVLTLQDDGRIHEASFPLR